MLYSERLVFVVYKRWILSGTTEFYSESSNMPLCILHYCQIGSFRNFRCGIQKVVFINYFLFLTHFFKFTVVNVYFVTTIIFDKSSFHCSNLLWNPSRVFCNLIIFFIIIFLEYKIFFLACLLSFNSEGIWKFSNLP